LFPPHVHPAAWGVCLALTALAAALPDSQRDLSPACWTLSLGLAALLALNLALAAQQLQMLRTLAPLVGAALMCRVAGAAAPGGRRTIVASLAALGSVAAAHGLYQAFLLFPRLAAAPDPAWSEAILARITSGRAVAGLGLPGALAGLLCMTLPLTWAAARAVRARHLRIAGLTACALQAGGLLATRSAAAIGCAMIAAAIVWSVARPAGGRRWGGAALLAGAERDWQNVLLGTSAGQAQI